MFCLKVLKIVEDEIKNGIPSENIIIGGFSQGGATALYSLLTSSFKFGGVLALSTWLPMHEKFPAVFLSLILRTDNLLKNLFLFKANGKVSS